ncbi:hypothetical protein ACH4HG_37980 [Streptomyces coeruleorubidus]|uniref:hypothetical protein n=1 Tax=Streptomyces coeruleorubidus TaxID=116188 RepID=UPI00379C4D2F
MSSRRRAAALLGFRDATEDWEVLVQRAAGSSGRHASPRRELLPPFGFVDAVAAGDAADVPAARRSCHQVAALATLAEVAGEALLRRILSQLPPGHADIFAVRIGVHR